MKVSHVPLPVVVEHEVPAASFLVVGLAHDALDVLLDMGMRNPPVGGNMNLQDEE